MMGPEITLGVVMVHLHSTRGYQHIHRQRRALAALCIGLSASLCAMTHAKADASIVVDTSQTQSDCGSNCDDLSTLQNIFQDASVPPEQASPGWPLYGPASQMIANLKMKRTRLLQYDVYCDVNSDGTVFGYTFNGTFTSTNGDCQPLGWWLQWGFSNGLSPHVAVASFMPPSFTSFGAAETWPAAQTARFKTYAYQLVNYVVQQAISAQASNPQITSVVFEVSNEIDIADSGPQNVHYIPPPQPIPGIFRRPRWRRSGRLVAGCGGSIRTALISINSPPPWPVHIPIPRQVWLILLMATFVGWITATRRSTRSLPKRSIRSEAKSVPQIRASRSPSPARPQRTSVSFGIPPSTFRPSKRTSWIRY
jgi:hypothetical protein